MIPSIDTWTQTQAIAFSILAGIIGAAVIVGALYIWARQSTKPAPIATSPSWMGKGRPSTLPATPAPIHHSAEANGRVLVTDVKGCARCGEDHPRRLLLKFTRPPKDATHYTVCPTTEEPLLVEVRNVDEAIARGTNTVDPSNMLDRQPPTARP